MQFDERDTPATTPTASPSPSPATTTGTAWTPASPAPRRSQEPGKPRRSQSQHPVAPRQSTPSRGQQEPGESQPPEDERQSQHPAEAERTQGQQEAPALPSPGNRERLRPCRASAQPNTRASTQQPAPREPTIWRGREGERGEERGSAQKITALQRRPAPAPDEATAQALHPCRQPSQHPRPDGQPWRAPSAREFNSAFVEYAELPLTNAAHAIPGEARQGGRFTF